MFKQEYDRIVNSECGIFGRTPVDFKPDLEGIDTKDPNQGLPIFRFVQKNTAHEFHGIYARFSEDGLEITRCSNN